MYPDHHVAGPVTPGRPHWTRTIALISFIAAVTIGGLWLFGELTRPTPGVPQEVVRPSWSERYAPPERPPHPADVYTPPGSRS